MAKINNGTLKNWSSGDTFTADAYEADREILRVANNDTDGKVESAKTDISKHETRIDELEYNVTGTVVPMTFKDLGMQNLTFDDIKLGYVDKKVAESLEGLGMGVTEEFTALNGQTVFYLVNSYTPGNAQLTVEVDGVAQEGSYEETNTNTITFSEPLLEGAKVLITIGGTAPHLDNRFNELREKFSPTKQKWVVMADSQPLSSEQLTKWRSLRDNITENHQDAELIIYAGDIVDNGDGNGETDPFLFPDMLEDLRKLPVPRSRIFAIPGNHDINMSGDSSTGEAWKTGMSYYNYLTAFERQYYYTIQGNIVTIYMGHMARNTAGNIVDYVVDWWKEIVRTNQDKVIITVTHQPIKDTVTGSTTTGGSLLESERFTSVLGTPGYRVDAWFSGHSGLDLNNPDKEDHILKYGCMFIDVDMNSGLSADGSGGGAGITSSYVTMEFEHKSSLVSFNRWNSDDNKISKSWNITVPHPVELSRDMLHDGRFSFDPKYDIITKPLRVTTNLKRVFNSTTQKWEASGEPTWVHHAMVEDRQNDDVTTGMGAGLLLYVPGANTGSSANNEPNINRAYGVGGGLAARRSSNAETGYESGLSLYVSGTGAGEDSLLEAVIVTKDGNVGILKSPDSGITHQVHGTGSLTYQRISNAAQTTAFDIGLSNVGDVYLRSRTAGDMRLYTNDTTRVILSSTDLSPNADNSYSLGKSSNRFSQLYAGTASINTSDEREKQQIEPINEAVLRAWGKVDYMQFKFNDAVQIKEGDARIHVGVIAQRVKEAFESEGLDPFAYGILCYDEWEEVPEIKNVLEDGTEEIIQEYQAGGNRYGIRYEEALALEAAYMRSELNKLKQV